MADARDVKFCIAAALITACPTAAHAHAGLEGAPAFWFGALHVVMAPIALAAIIGFSAVIARTKESAALAGLAAIGAGAIISAFMPSDALAAAGALGAIVLGLAAAAAIRLGVIGSALSGLGAGTAAASAVAIEAPGGVAILGAGFAAVILCVSLCEILSRLPMQLALAPRILGAWVAAIGLLVGALALRTPAFAHG